MKEKMRRLYCAVGRTALDRRFFSNSFLKPLFSALCLVVGMFQYTVAADRPIRVLFLGDKGHHLPAERFAQIAPVMQKRGIEMIYTDRMTDLEPAVLDAYDALAVYANIDELPLPCEAAIVDFVRGGKGLIPLHCASFCFRNSPLWVDMVGAQFQKHGTGEFRTTLLEPEHPVMKGFTGFSSWDETYVHTRHNDRGRTVLEERVEGDHHEPWTWVRNEGKGRVFYTAWGHDQRTWSHPGFQNLLERGIRFASGRDLSAVSAYVDHPVMTQTPKGLKPFEYQSAKVPLYDPGGTWGAMKEPLSSMQKPLDPEESKKHAITPEGFCVELFASEPLLQAKPLACAWDSNGRMFLAESVDYPNELVEKNTNETGSGHDRIVFLDDTDRDGKADTRTVFAENLSIPTSMLSHAGGLLVAQAPDILFLKDTDNDGKADLRNIVLSGWGIGDTHAGPSNLTWGLDGWVYGMVGYSGFSGKVGDEKHQFGQGFFRFKADGSKLEFLRSTNNNSWGLGFSEEGLLFGSTANGNPSEYMPLANRVYERVKGWSATTLGGIAGTPQMELAPAGNGLAKIRQVDHHGRFTAAAGHRLYTARAYPKAYWNRTAFVTEPTGHIVATFELSPQGASFSSRMGFNLVASDDEWTAPIAAEIGPDGNVWVIDWYNYIVQHNPTPAGFETGKRGAYVTPLRDKTHGRIWRIVYEQAQKEASGNSRQKIESHSTVDMLSALASDNLFWRSKAARLLIERGASRPDGGRDIAASLVSLVEDDSVDAIGLNAPAIHAMWVMKLLGLLDEHADADALAAVHAAMTHDSVGVRMNAIAVLPRNLQTLAAIQNASVGSDSHALVRLAVLECLGEMPVSDDAARMVSGMLADARTVSDSVLSDAATSAAAVQAEGVLPELLAGKNSEVISPLRIALIERVSEHVARGGDADMLKKTIETCVRANPSAASSALAGFAKGWPLGKNAEFGESTEKAIATIVERLDPVGQGQLVTLVQRCGSKILEAHIKKISQTFLAQLDRKDVPEIDRRTAAEQLIALRPSDPAAVTEVLLRVDARSNPEFASALVAAAAKSNAPGAADAILDRAVEFTPSVREAAVRAILANRQFAAVLVDRLKNGKTRLEDIPLVERNRLAEHPDREVRDQAKKILAKGGSLPNPDRQKVIDELLEKVSLGGDAIKGKVLYAAQCGKCHTHSGVGGKVGPDLTGTAVHPRNELLTHILDPNRNVEGNFRAYTASTQDGRVVTGLLASESRTAIELVDAEGKRHAIQREEIDLLQPSSKSLMPEGFEKLIPVEGFVDLLAFLTAKGQFVPLVLDKVATAVSTKGLFYSTENMGERLVFDDWSPKIFEGVPFTLVDPKGQSVPNIIMLHGPLGSLPPKMPRSVKMPLGTATRAIYLLGGVSGWGFPATAKGSVSLIVRLHYANGETEDLPLENGEHMADYVRRIDVPKSMFAFDLNGRQIRSIRLHPGRTDVIREVELLKGPDDTAPIVMAITVETL